LAESLRTDARLMPRLCPDIGRPKSGGLLDLMQAMEAAKPLGNEVVALNRALRNGGSLESVAAQARDPVAALAYLLAADRVIQVDDFAPG
jgi:acyl-CoA dehydrogenase